MRLMLAGGGTGGHLFPGVAIAEAVRARDPEAEVLFVGTERGIEARVLPELGFDVRFIEASGLKTVGLRGAVRGLLRVPRALWQSRRIVKAFDPDVVIGVGGYASGPALLAARLMRRPTAILEQNSIPGLTNKILGRIVHTVFLAFDETRRFFRARKIDMSGTPIRASIRARLVDGDAARAQSEPGAGARGDRFRVFVFGGSQGAKAVNELFADAAALLAARGTPIDVVHQTGPRHLDATRARYAAHGIDADCRAFIDDMASEYRRADLVIARAGAGTVSELAVVGCAALLIPYPYAADNHQEVNARELVAAGAARMFRERDLTGERLADAVAELMEQPEALERMRSAMKGLGRPDAAEHIATWCEDRATARRRKT